jgi:hypothetical protein
MFALYAFAQPIFGGTPIAVVVSAPIAKFSLVAKARDYANSRNSNYIMMTQARDYITNNRRSNFIFTAKSRNYASTG